MNVNFGYPKYMPSPYSVYVSKFNEQTLAFLKSVQYFARYSKVDKDYEITPELYEKLKKVITEPIYECNQLPDHKLYEPFVWHDDYPYQYQDDAVAFMLKNDFGLINFSQGLGKSRTTMCIIEARKDIHKTLIITGVSNLQEEWLKDAKKHKAKNGQTFAEYLNMRIVAEDPGSSVKKRIEYLRTVHKDEDHFTDLIGIESCRDERVIEALNALKYDCIVVDEIQAAKGMSAEQTLGVHEIEYHEGQVRLALSGTPVLNDPLEFYSVLRFLKVLYYKSRVDQCSRSAFNNYYGEWGLDFFGHFECKGYKNLAQLRELIEPVRIYAPKSLLRLPKKTRQIVNLPVTDPTYEDLVRLYRKGTSAVKRAGYKTVQALASQLQVMTSAEKSKIDFIKEQIRKGNRPLVFSMYTTVLDEVKRQLERVGYNVAYYHGKLNSKQRLDVLSNWTAGKGDVILLSIMTARYGLNLQQTQVAIFLEPPTSPAILEQAEDRLWRIGQTKEVFSYCLLAGYSDESDWHTIERKQKDVAFFSKEEIAE